MAGCAWSDARSAAKTSSARSEVESVRSTANCCVPYPRAHIAGLEARHGARLDLPEHTLRRSQAVQLFDVAEPLDVDDEHGERLVEIL